MADSVPETINTLLDAVDGELTSRSRVVDGLLDIRLAAGDDPELVGRLDEVLADVPGLTTVSNAWWLETLGDLRELATAPDPVSA